MSLPALTGSSQKERMLLEENDPRDAQRDKLKQRRKKKFPSEAAW